MALSSTEVEYIAIQVTTKKLIWIRYFLDEMNFQFQVLQFDSMIINPPLLSLKIHNSMIDQNTLNFDTTSYMKK